MEHLASSLIAYPSFLAGAFKGYEHFTDKTVMDFNKLASPSRNCTIPSFDMVVPDLGKTLLGQEFTENSGINGNKEKYKNLGGLEMEAREWSSEDPNLKDVIEVLFPNNRLVFTVLSGTFEPGETISGQTSGASAIITDVVGTVLFLREFTNIDFEVGELVVNTGFTASGTVVKSTADFFLQLTENTNPLPQGAHEYYFDSWFDTNLNNPTAPNVPSKGLPRLTWVNGYQDPATKKGVVYSWTGGLGVITSIVVDTSISINPATTFRSLGFTEDASGNVSIIVNGIAHTVAVPADIDTNTIRITSTTDITIGDFVTSKIETDVSVIPFDHCRQNKGYMFYGNWNFPNEYQSNAFNRSAQLEITNVQAALNDLITNPASAYTGTTESVYHIVIDTVSPDINTQTFTGSGLNDGIFQGTGGVALPAGYTGNPGDNNTYKIVMVADYTLIITSGTFVTGETLIGSVSGAQGVVVAAIPSGGNTIYGIRLLTNIGFFINDAITNSNNIAGPFIIVATFSEDWFQYIKNNVVVNIAGEPINELGTSLITLTDGLVIQYANDHGHTVGDTLTLNIRTGGIDTFKWQKDGGAFTSLIPITTTFQTLSLGVQIKLLNFNGHAVGDFWDVTAIPSITRAWVNFYYALPTRRPGEGYIYNLPSNFWTHDTQEDTLYVNSSFGEWGEISTVLSADLKSETVSYSPLKQVGANKVLYPYLTGHNNDMLCWINTKKQLNTLGRQPLLEKPQTGYLSDRVKLDFEASSFIGGRIKYHDKKLNISSPREGLMHVYDTYKDYWQAPKDFPEVGLLSTVGNDLVCHSNTRNQSFTMFTNTGGDNGASYTVHIHTGTTAVGDRWSNKNSSMSFIEGYITGNPRLIHSAYLWTDKQKQIKSHDVLPIALENQTGSPFGEGPFGGHPFGSDFFESEPHFYEIYKDYGDTLSYYFISLGITCTAKSHTYKILTLGMNGMKGITGNTTLMNQSAN